MTSFRNALQVVAVGKTVTRSGSSASTDIPTVSTGAFAKMIRLVRTTAVHAKLCAPGGGLSSVTVNTAGAGFLAAPTVAVTGDGTGATAHATMKGLVPTAIAARGTGYVVADVLTQVGGVGTATRYDVATLELDSTALNAAGTAYVANEVVTLAGGTSTVKATVTINTIKLVSAAVNAAGSGYNVGDTITLAGGTSTTKAVLTVATLTGGAGTGVATFTITTAGSYTVGSATFTQFATSGGGTGFTANTAVFGINTFTITARGNYTVPTVTFTQNGTTGSGTGATFNVGVFGVRSVTVHTAGSYTVTPSNPVSVTGGTGTLATITAQYGVNTIVVDTAGKDYDSASIVLSGDVGDSNAAFTANLAAWATATADDMMITTYPVLLKVMRGQTHIAYIEEATAAKLNITPVEVLI